MAASKASSGCLGEVAPQSRRHQIVVDGVGLERGGIRRFRQIQANALHGRHEGLAGELRIGGGRPGCAGGADPLPVESQRQGRASRYFEDMDIGAV